MSEDDFNGEMEEEVVDLPIDGALDLHHFHPKDLKTLLPNYLEECRSRDILEVRIIHGKGKGVLRRTVHAFLDRSPWVLDYRLAPEARGGWGATLVTLMPPDAPPES